MGSPTNEPTQIAEGAVMKGLSDDNVDNHGFDVEPKEERAFVRIPVHLQ